MDEAESSCKDVSRDTISSLSPRSEEKTPRILLILNDPQQRMLFQKFCKAKFCHENLAFYDEVELYERLSDEFVRPLRAHAIFEKYISPEAPLQVNIDENVISEISGNLEKGEPFLFARAKSEVMRLMDEGTFMGFISSSIYLEYLKRLTNPGPMLPVAGSEEAEGEKIILLDSWVRSR